MIRLIVRQFIQLKDKICFYKHVMASLLLPNKGLFQIKFFPSNKTKKQRRANKIICCVHLWAVVVNDGWN